MCLSCSVRFWKWKGKIHPNCDHVRLTCNHSKYEERRLHKKRTDNGDVDVKVRKKWCLETWQTGTHGLQLQTGQVKSGINYKRKFRAWKTGLPAWQITTLACQFIRRPIPVSIETTAALCCHQLLFQASVREMVVYSENTSFTYLLFFNIVSWSLFDTVTKMYGMYRENYLKTVHSSLPHFVRKVNKL